MNRKRKTLTSRITETLALAALLLAACGAPAEPEAPGAAQAAPARAVLSARPGATITAADLAALPPGALLDLDLRAPEASYGVDFSDGAGDLSRLRVTLRSGKSQLLPAWLEEQGLGLSEAPTFRVSAPGVTPQLNLCCKKCICTPDGCACDRCRKC